MMRAKVIAGYSVLSFLASVLFAYGVAQWIYRGLDKAVSQAWKEKA